MHVNHDKSWAATGQTDPKDTPGQGKDMSKIMVWDYNSMKVVKLIKDAAWGQVKKLRFSGKSKYLYSMGGEDSQPISAWDTSSFGSKGQQKPLMKNDTYREEIFGMVMMDSFDKDTSVDEIIMFGRRRVSYAYVTSATKRGKKSLALKCVKVNTAKANGGPKA